MAGLSNFVVCLVLLFGACAARKVKDAREFDFFYLVRQWPGTFCSQHACPLLTDRDWPRFTIHGLWPNFADGTWPEFCDKTKPFDADEISDLHHQLDEFWPSYMDTSSSEDFWAHEWNKHGTCALKELPSQHKFFKSVLKLNQRYELGRALHNNDIEPSIKRSYKKQEILDAIKDTFGVDALVHCAADGGLTEIWMCIDKDLNAMDCEPNAKDANKCSRININPVPGAHRQGWFTTLPMKVMDIQKAEVQASDDEVHSGIAASSPGASASSQAVAVTATVGAVTIAPEWQEEGDEALAMKPAAEGELDHDRDDDDEHDDDEHDDDEKEDREDHDVDDDDQEEEEEEEEGKQDTKGGEQHVNSAIQISAMAQSTSSNTQSAATVTTAGTKGRVSSSSRHQPHVFARTLCISGAGALLAAIVLTTIVSSWSRRLAAQEGAGSGLGWAIGETDGADVLEEPLLHGVRSPRSPSISESGAADPEVALKQPLMQQ